MSAARRLAALVAAGAAALTLAPTAGADHESDVDFYRLLTRDGILIWDYNLMRAQGLRACYQESAGLSGLRAVYNLSPPYDFDTANSIVAAANVVYCPWNLGN